MTALPPSTPGGKADPALPYETKLNSFVAVHVPTALTLPDASLWVNVPLPVTELGWMVKVPVPATDTESPLVAIAMSGHALGIPRVHKKSTPTSQLYSRCPLSAKAKFAKETGVRATSIVTSA